MKGMDHHTTRKNYFHLKTTLRVREMAVWLKHCTCPRNPGWIRVPACNSILVKRRQGAPKASWLPETSQTSELRVIERNSNDKVEEQITHTYTLIKKKVAEDIWFSQNPLRCSQCFKPVPAPTRLQSRSSQWNVLIWSDCIAYTDNSYYLTICVLQR